MLIPFNDSVRVAMFQFSFSNKDAVPAHVRRMCMETDNDHDRRKAVMGGEQFIVPTENCSLVGVREQLEGAGWILADASYQERQNKKDASGWKTYHMVRFIFARAESVKADLGDLVFQKRIASDFDEIVTRAFWRVRGYVNPYRKNGVEVAGETAASINLEVRKPLLRPDGEPVTEWTKVNGERVGEGPVPLRPSHLLTANVEGITLGTTTI